MIMKKILLITGCLAALFFTACNKELSDNFNTYANHPLNDTAWTGNITNTASVHELFDLLAPGFILDSFNVTTGGSLHYGDSLEFAFKPGSCVVAGSATVPSGYARLDIFQLKRKGDFIKFFKPTVTEKGSLLETGGGLFIRVSKDGQELTLAPGKTVMVKFGDTAIAKTNMQGFYGKETMPPPPKGMDTSFYWMRDADISPLPTWSKISSNPSVPSYYGYEMNAKNFRWIAAERYIDSTRPKVKITAILAPNYTNKNTAVFAVFADQKTVVNLRGDYASRSFFANNIPLKSAVKLVSLSNIAGQLYLGVKDISSVEVVTGHKVLPEKKSLQDILIFLNNL
jgi:hypothetical protein